jgi:hypothetical protein
MMTLEILRMAIDIGTWGMGRAAFLAYRAAVLTALVAGGVAVGAVLVRKFRWQISAAPATDSSNICWKSSYDSTLPDSAMSRCRFCRSST